MKNRFGCGKVTLSLIRKSPPLLVNVKAPRLTGDYSYVTYSHLHASSVCVIEVNYLLIHFKVTENQIINFTLKYEIT